VSPSLPGSYCSDVGLFDFNQYGVNVSIEVVAITDQDGYMMSNQRMIETPQVKYQWLLNLQYDFQG
jgi:hypothetical protein